MDVVGMRLLHVIRRDSVVEKGCSLYVNLYVVKKGEWKNPLG